MSSRLIKAVAIGCATALLLAGCATSQQGAQHAAESSSTAQPPDGSWDRFEVADPMPRDTMRQALADPKLADAYDYLQHGLDGTRPTIDLGKAGNPAAQTAACVDFRTGFRINPDEWRSQAACKDAAMDGYVLAEYEIGQTYYHYESAFNAVNAETQDVALHWLHAAAVHGITEADFALLRAFSLGEGVATNKDLALAYLNEARSRLGPQAEAVGHNVSCHALPDYYAARYGLGRDQDVAAAKIPLMQAVEADCWVAQMILASLYHYGVDGFPQDFDAAANYSRRAAQIEVAYVYGRPPSGWRP